MNGLHDPRLATLSVLIAVLTGFAALNLVQRVTLSRALAARSWLTFGSLLMGAGLWSMHYVGLLAFQLPIAVVYHVPTMLFSLGIAVLVSFFVLWVASAPHTGLVRLAVAGLCMALGLACMYYVNVFSMQIVPAVFFETRPLAVSLVIAVLASWLTLGLGALLRDGVSGPILLARAAAGIVVGLALWWHQYEGVLAARFADDSYSLGATFGQDVDGNGLLSLLAAASALAVLAVMLLTIFDHARHAFADANHPDPASAVMRDTTTGVANQLALERRFLAARDAHPRSLIALLRIDTDRARWAHAHPMHDTAVWQELARRLGTLVRPHDTVARLEDGHFVLLLANLADAGPANRVAARVREEFSRVVEVPDAHVEVTSRIGSSLFPQDGGDLDTLLRLARANQSEAAT